MKGRIVIAVYKPKPGKNSELDSLMKTHWHNLKAENLVSERTPIIMKSDDGTYLEVFEWRSKDALENAHSNPAVIAMWKQYEQVCTYIPASEVSEISNLFSEFSPVN